MLKRTTSTLKNIRDTVAFELKRNLQYLWYVAIFYALLQLSFNYIDATIFKAKYSTIDLNSRDMNLIHNLEAKEIEGVLLDEEQTGIVGLGIQNSDLDLHQHNIQNIQSIDADTFETQLTTKEQPYIHEIGTQTKSLNLGGNDIVEVGTLNGTISGILDVRSMRTITTLGTLSSNLNMGGYPIKDISYLEVTGNEYMKYDLAFELGGTPRIVFFANKSGSANYSTYFTDPGTLASDAGFQVLNSGIYAITVKNAKTSGTVGNFVAIGLDSYETNISLRESSEGSLYFGTYPFDSSGISFVSFSWVGFLNANDTVFLSIAQWNTSTNSTSDVTIESGADWEFKIQYIH